MAAKKQSKDLSQNKKQSMKMEREGGDRRPGIDEITWLFFQIVSTLEVPQEVSALRLRYQCTYTSAKSIANKYE